MEIDDVVALVGRLLLAAIFLASAFGKVTAFAETVKYMEAHGMPAAVFFCAAAAVVEALGGLSLLLGFQTRWGAAALGAFLIAASWIFHPVSAPEQRVNLLKNLAILGGLLQVVAFGPGGMSLEGRQKS
jgi:putative oxidoreductase